MKYLRNEDGIALVTALMFTLICLAMIMTLMYYVLTATKMSAAQKKYRSSLEASYGGSELMTKTIIPRLFSNYTTGRLSLAADFGGTGTNKLDLQINGPGMSDSATLKAKLNKGTNDWPAGIPGRSVDPKNMPDFIFTLKGANAASNFKVYGKIVDTIAGVGLIDASGVEYLDAGIGVAGTSTSTQTPRTPNIYSVEVQGEAAVNPKEKAGLTVLYAY
jgi:hypothetical protein